MFYPCTEWMTSRIVYWPSSSSEDCVSKVGLMDGLSVCGSERDAASLASGASFASQPSSLSVDWSSVGSSRKRGERVGRSGSAGSSWGGSVAWRGRGLRALSRKVGVLSVVEIHAIRERVRERSERYEKERIYRLIEELRAELPVSLLRCDPGMEPDRVDTLELALAYLRKLKE